MRSSDDSDAESAAAPFDLADFLDFDLLDSSFALGAKEACSDATVV